MHTADLKTRSISFPAVFLISAAFAFAPPLITWYILYPLVGYSPASLTAALSLSLLTAGLLIAVFRLHRFKLGLGPLCLIKAAALTATAYGAVVLLVLVLNLLFESNLPLLRSSYRLDAFLDGWLLTGFGEELLFSGVLFTLLAGRLPPRRRWQAVLAIAVLFALWHLPGYLAQGRSGGDLFGRMALNAASWLFFGSIYAISGNLWMAAMAHASTDYALTPVITDSPLIGLLFMASMVLLAWLSSRPAAHEGTRPAVELPA
jgi:membrane protease YdiL (CAAX protease family)